MYTVEPIEWALWLTAIVAAGIALLLGDGVVNARGANLHVRSRIIVPLWVLVAVCVVSAIAVAGVAALRAVSGWS